MLTIIGLGMLVITVCDLGHHSLAAAAAAAGAAAAEARLSRCRQRRDSQPGCSVSSAAVPGLDGHKKRRGRVKHWDCLIFFQSFSDVAAVHFPVY